MPSSAEFSPCLGPRGLRGSPTMPCAARPTAILAACRPWKPAGRQRPITGPRRLVKPLPTFGA
eukprot:8747007-Lingulodinium_polyedra.AAC.1